MQCADSPKTASPPLDIETIGHNDTARLSVNCYLRLKSEGSEAYGASKVHKYRA